MLGVSVCGKRGLGYKALVSIGALFVGFCLVYFVFDPSVSSQISVSLKL